MQDQQNENADENDLLISAAEPTEQYLTFFMDNEEYGVDILSVQEIRGWESATAIPNAPSHVKGVINLRGTVVPIIDLRQRFGLKEVEYGPTTVVIVLKISNQKQGQRVMGIVVDAVSDVHQFKSSEIQPSPEMSENANTAYVKGLGSVGDEMVILLDISAMLNADDTKPLLGAVTHH
ncbi:MAG: chemotaxis protein CheW [Pseudomonadales bacterium]|uniref:Chemotaxis protein CheW n=1 Tax=Oleiphilus messinensis TaxID=141451 RepID=A0A1Y0IAN1_9GAMM|nr:chemotaxis protein CheW [Oleiphilus messinensis]ARU57582.1 chemotaxis signal transduction protein CheW [Oleiphilus messinensis]MCG8610910.1 chemotaxis protein CheW [Pseudomonadales bacterium]